MDALLITTAVLFPFGWFIYWMIRYTAKSLGEESPLSVPVSYSIDAWDYFMSFNFLFLIFYTVLNILFLYATLFIFIPAAVLYWHWLLSASFLAVTLTALWWAVRLFDLEWQYWTITKDKTITLDPTDKSLEVADWDGTVRITAADVEEIEKHAPGPSSGKLVAGYQYFIFKLKDGRRIYLNHNKSYLDYSIGDYFKTVPSRYVPHKIPWIIAP